MKAHQQTSQHTWHCSRERVVVILCLLMCMVSYTSSQARDELTRFQEQEPNDSFVQANHAGMADQIEGLLSQGADARDTFLLHSGARSGPWAYAVNFYVRESGVPLGMRLQLRVKSGGNDFYAQGSGHSAWIILPPETDVYVEVGLVGVASGEDRAYFVMYTIDVIRHPIQDANEPDDTTRDAKILSATHTTSYLCNVYSGRHNKHLGAIGLRDTYRVQAPGQGEALHVAVLNAGLRGPHNVVRLELYNAQGRSITHTEGTAEAAFLTYTIPSEDRGNEQNGWWYVVVTNGGGAPLGRDADAFLGSGRAPESCLQPYTILVGDAAKTCRASVQDDDFSQVRAIEDAHEEQLPVLLREFEKHFGERIKRVYAKRTTQYGGKRPWEIWITELVEAKAMSYWSGATNGWLYERDMLVGYLDITTGQFSSPADMDARKGALESPDLVPGLILDGSSFLKSLAPKLLTKGGQLARHLTEKLTRKCGLGAAAGKTVGKSGKPPVIVDTRLPRHGTAEAAARLPTRGQWSEHEFEKRLSVLQKEIDTERAQVSLIREGMSATEWRRQMRAKTKHLYNLLEKRHVLTLQRTFPDRMFLEQVEIVGVKSSRGSVMTAGEKRIADWAEINQHSNTVQLGDIKSSSTMLQSVRGGLKHPDDIEGVFRSTTEIAQQHEKELTMIRQAQRVDGEVLLRGRDLEGKSVEWSVPPSRLLPSRVSFYQELGRN